MNMNAMSHLRLLSLPELLVTQQGVNRIPGIATATASESEPLSPMTALAMTCAEVPWYNLSPNPDPNPNPNPDPGGCVCRRVPGSAGLCQP